MAVSWKKLRISELVADLRSPSKRRRSLVVETGFPTSLFDLFVKNRDRLRKSSSKRTQNHHLRRSRRTVDSSDPRSEIPVKTTPPPPPEELVEVDSVIIDRKYFGSKLFGAVVKAFVVAALAMSTKKLVVGVTLSAFALLLLECVGNRIDPHFCAFLKPCFDGLFGLIRSGPKKASRGLGMDKCESLNGGAVDEIEMVGDCNFEEESCVDVRKVVEEDGDGDGGGVAGLLCGKNNQSRSSRIKAKIIKKCVPRKLRDLRKKKTSKGADLDEDEEESGDKSGYFSVGEVDDCIEERVGCENIDNDNDNDDEKELELESEIPWCCEPLPVSVEGRGREGNGYQTLVLVVLAGLVGGRIWALALTLVWCLGLKTLGNVRMMRSLVSIRRYNFWWSRIQ